jgi:hypothetical protein
MSYKIVTHIRPMIDTGIGQEMGYESDRAFLDDQRRERETMDPEVARLLDAAKAEIEVKMMFGGSGFGA